MFNNQNKILFKLITLLSLILFTQSAFSAEIKNLVSNLSSLNFKNGQLDFSYSIGGGCQPHSASVEVEIIAEPKDGYTIYSAKVNIYDVSPGPDHCEAMIGVTGSADLKTAIAQAAKTAGYSGNYIDIILPKVSLYY